MLHGAVSVMIRKFSVDESAMTDGKVDITKVAPITFDPFNNAYHVIGEKVGNAFRDGVKLK